MNNNILISFPSSLGVYQYETKNGDISQEINILGGWNQNQETAELVVHVTHAIINI